MSLYEQWIRQAYNDKTGEIRKDFWDGYLPVEQTIYEYFLDNKENTLSGKLEALAERFDMSPDMFTGFLHGINETLHEQITIEELELDSEISLSFDWEVLYKKMVQYKAEHLYSMPKWSNVFSEEQLKTFFKEQKTSGTVVKGDKIGRNDPCTCGSGKKYKKCCGI